MIVLVALAVVGGGIYVIAARLRAKQLSLEGEWVKGTDEQSQQPPHGLIRGLPAASRGSTTRPLATPRLDFGQALFR